MRVYEELNYLNYGGKLSTYTRIPVFSCIPCSSFHAHSMRCSVSIPCTIPCLFHALFHAHTKTLCMRGASRHSWFFPGHARPCQAPPALSPTLLLLEKPGIAPLVQSF